MKAVLLIFAALPCLAAPRRLARSIPARAVVAAVTNAPSGAKVSIPETGLSEWKVGTRYAASQCVTYSNSVWCCVQGHTVFAPDWTPAAVPALWRKIRAVGDTGIQEWIQPLGAHDAYRINALVKHLGKTWKTAIDYNVWEPGVYGWAVQ